MTVATKDASRTILIGVTSDVSLGFHEGVPEELSRNGWDVHLVSAAGPALASMAQASGAQAHAIEMKREPSPILDLHALSKWFRLIRVVKPEVVLLGTPKGSLLGMIAARLGGTPRRIYFMHGLRLETSRGLRRQLLWLFEWMTCRLATDVLAVSSSLRHAAINAGVVKSDKIAVLGRGSANGIDLTRFTHSRSSAPIKSLRLSLGLDEDLPTIGFVGRIVSDKGLKILARALSILAGRSVEAQVLVVGASESKESTNLLSKLNATGLPVVYAGPVADTSPYFALMDVFCLPSKREGLGLVLIEAMASRVPVVATRITGIVDVVDHRVTGFLVDPYDESALADALQEALCQTDMLRKMVDDAHDMVSREFDRPSVQRRLIRYILLQAPVPK